MPEHPLRAATKAYVTAAMDLLRSRCEPCPDQDDTFSDWVRASDQMFRLQPRKRHWWHECMIRNGDALHALPEYFALAELLGADAEIAPLLDQMIGDGMTAHHVERSRITDHLIWELAQRTGAGEFDLAGFDDAFAVWDAELRAGSVRRIWIAPLMGLSSATSTIRLSSEAMLVRLTDEEIALALSMGLILSSGHPRTTFSSLRSVPIVHGLRIVNETKRVVGEIQSDTREAERVWKDVNDLAEDVLIALRIFKSDRVACSGFVTRHVTWPLGGSFQFGNLRDFPPPSWPQGFGYDLGADEAAAFPEFFSSYRKAAQKSSIEIAARRFAYASDRSRSEDRIIDLMVAAEALFLTDASTELGYRLALRGACFLHEDAALRSQTLRFLQDAYDARSKIAHGSKPNKKKLRSVGGAECDSIQQFAKEVEEVVRLAVRRAIERVARTGMFPSNAEDWNALILAPTLASAPPSDHSDA